MAVTPKYDISLKSIKINHSFSGETFCYSAIVYVNGIRSFEASNNGGGGCDRYHTLPSGKLSPTDTQKLVKDIEYYLCETKETSGFGSLDALIADLLGKHAAAKEAKRILKKIAYSDGKSIYSLKSTVKPTQDNLYRVKQEKWWQNEYVLLNELALDKVTEIIQDPTKTASILK